MEYQFWLIVYHSVFVFPFFDDLQHTQGGERVTFADSRSALPAKSNDGSLTSGYWFISPVGN